MLKQFKIIGVAPMKKKNKIGESVLLTTIIASGVVHANIPSFNMKQTVIVQDNLDTNKKYSITFPAGLINDLLPQLQSQDLTVIDSPNLEKSASIPKEQDENAGQLQNMLKQVFGSDSFSVAPLETMKLSGNDGWQQK
jgi:hypothetical protein